MELNTSQADSLTELINIGYGRAAAALSELTGYRISLDVPAVVMHPIDEIAPLLLDTIPGKVATVNQAFAGSIAGNALMMLDENSALLLSQLLLDERSAPQEFDASAREIITEVGNILLNACLGVFGNLLQVQVSFSVPRLQVDSVAVTLDNIKNDHPERLRYALMIHTRFQLRASNVIGYLFIVLGITSLDRMLLELEKWENRQISFS